MAGSVGVSRPYRQKKCRRQVVGNISDDSSKTPSVNHSDGCLLPVATNHRKKFVISNVFESSRFRHCAIGNNCYRHEGADSQSTVGLPLIIQFYRWDADALTVNISFYFSCDNYNDHGRRWRSRSGLIKDRCGKKKKIVFVEF